jgi:hypothetical protein
VHNKVHSVDFGPGTLTPDRSNEMTDVTVTNRRADSSANEALTKLARHGADTFGYKANLRIDRKLAQLLRLRVSHVRDIGTVDPPRGRGPRVAWSSRLVGGGGVEIVSGGGP